MYILLAILLLAILVAVHEFGHFTAARLMKIDVREFAIGFGPKIIGWKSRKHETAFSVRVIPLGGFCAFYGEDDTTGDQKDDPRAFARHNVWKRMFVILSGPLMNFVLALVAAMVMFWCFGMKTYTGGVEPYIAEVMAAGPAYSAGMREKDVITEINGENMLDGTMETLLNTIGSWKEGDAPLRMTIRRGEKTFEAEMTPVWDAESFGRGIGLAFETCGRATGAIAEALGTLFSSREVLDSAMGPVGIVSYVSGEVETGGASSFIELLVVISINLGLMNLLPIPGLDGSRLVFGIIEILRGKPVPPEKEAKIHLIGMVFLFGVLIFFTFRDISGLFR